MLSADVCQLLEMKLIGKEGAEPLHGRVITTLGEFAALSVVPGDTVQLGHQTQIYAGADYDICHRNSLYFMKIIVQMGTVRPLAFAPFPLFFL